MATVEITEFITLAILALVGYLGGLLTTLMILKRVRRYEENERIGKMYEEKISEYEKTLADIMLRLNIIELRLRNKQISQEKEYHITYHKPIEYKESVKTEVEGIEKKVLSILLEGSKTSREIEVAIGRSREHTARLMKKLYEKGYVIRDTSNKPYKYSITEVGKSIIEAEVV
ncbi:MAG: hypothetical protein KatS3mg003_1861 [Candidatus Nitrosocaldaceae archaeon]|nr:MAG: hypothetical protein KatS3mg003_1861 [Candidatus Nitrosocaldaceae archaeon]